MKYLLIFTTLLLFTVTASAERVFHVSVDGSAAQAGSSWDAPTDLATAAAQAVAGDQIWVEVGTYMTTSGQDRSVSIRLAAGVNLYGGFIGEEATVDQRPAGVQSVLSGDIGTPGADEDNAYTVLTLLNDTNAETVVDGFVITGGTARSFTQGFTAGNAGGGIYIAANGNQLPAHQISNCTIRNNKGHNGAGVYVAGGNSSFDNCLFTDNIADFMGGAIFNQGAGSEANVRFTECDFERNGADYGGAMANNGENGITNPLAISCTFSFNVARTNGAVAYNMTNETGECTLINERCGFDNNSSILGEDIATKGDKKSLAQLQQDSENARVIISGASSKK